MGSSKSWITVLLAILLLAASMGTAAAGSFGSDVNKMLAETKAATAKYHQIERALDDGYELGSSCIENMGYHYINIEYAMTPGHDHTKPEVLVYEEMKNGKLKLVAVEFVAFGGEQPELYGQKFDDGPPGIDYALHAWVWKHNKDGMFEAENKAARCN